MWQKRVKIALFLILIILSLACCSNTLEPLNNLGPAAYTLEEASHVKIVIKNSYDTIVAIPVDEVQPPGTHVFNIRSNKDLVEGIYFITIYINGEVKAEYVQIIILEEQ